MCFSSIEYVQQIQNQNDCTKWVNLPDLFLISSDVASINGYKILGIFLWPSQSHCAVGNALMDSLVEDGLEVTIVSPFSLNKSITNYTDVPLEHSWVGLHSMESLNKIEIRQLKFFNRFYQRQFVGCEWCTFLVAFILKRFWLWHQSNWKVTGCKQKFKKNWFKVANNLMSLSCEA